MKKIILFSIALIMISCNNTSKEVDEKTGPTNADRIQALYDAFAVGDVEAVLGSFTEDIVWNEAENFIYADGNPYEGRDAVATGVFQRVGDEWEYWNLADTKIYNVESDKVLAMGRYQAKNKATEKLLDAQFVHFFTFRDTLVSSFQQYADTKQTSEVVMADEE